MRENTFKLFTNFLNYKKMAQSYILQENVLTDNILLLPEKNKVFKGGYIAIIKEYTFLNSYDKETIKRFRNESQLNSYLSKKYPDFYFYG